VVSLYNSATNPRLDRDTRQASQELFDQHAALYVMLVMLAERQKGNLPAYEGIRLVRERVETESISKAKR
jgi:hypothetical protein